MFAKEIERTYLRRGMEVTVSTRGEGATVLHIDWVLCSKATVFQLSDGENGALCQQAGFTRSAPTAIRRGA